MTRDATVSIQVEDSMPETLLVFNDFKVTFSDEAYQEEDQKTTILTESEVLEILG